MVSKEYEVNEFLAIQKELKINRYKQLVSLGMLFFACVAYILIPWLSFSLMGLSLLSFAETIFPSREKQILDYIKRGFNKDSEKLIILSDKVEVI